MDPVLMNWAGFALLIVGYLLFVVVKVLLKKAAHKTKMVVLHLKGDKDA